MAKRSSKRARKESSGLPKPEAADTVEEAEAEAGDEDVGSETPEPVAPEPPPPPDTNVMLAIIGMAVIGALMGGVTTFANNGMTVGAALEGLLGGLTMGAAAGHSLLMPFRLQAIVLIVMVVLAFGLYWGMGTWGVPWAGLIVAGTVGLLLSLGLARMRGL